MKCYSTPKQTSKRIDDAIDRAYREHYMGQPQQPSARDAFIASRCEDSGKQLIEDSYQAYMRRKEDASKDTTDASPRDAWIARRTADSGGQLSEGAASSYRRNLEPSEGQKIIEDSYQAYMERKQNAWRDDAQAQREAAHAEFIAKRHGGNK